MNLQTLSRFDIKFDVVKEADATYIPVPIGSLPNNYYVKTRKSFALAFDNTITVPTGIRILDFPEFTINYAEGLRVDVYTEAELKPILKYKIRYGIDVIGPQIITKDYTDELCVTLKNTSKQIFSADAGDEIAILSFNIKPCIDFNVLMENQLIPKEMR